MPGNGNGQDFSSRATDGNRHRPFFAIGDASVTSVSTTIKFDYLSQCTSAGIGFSGLSGGLDILNVGILSSSSPCSA